MILSQRKYNNKYKKLMYKFEDTTIINIAATDSSCDPTTDIACTGFTTCNEAVDPTCISQPCDPSTLTDGSCIE